ncbi:5726_t:CDS:2 [Cetraspora pellucida]|uniref:5726_t:CDS:1 n=1 Tax=Cetraspora pellucida TaxID=1433469 RepID=A0A9N9NRF8_9GLOM|nr:5726_t:CDS:2 [Cetraspora pellucida]
MPKKAVSKQNSRTSKKDTVSTSKKALMSSDKKNTSSIKNKRTYNDQNKISESHKFENFDHNDSVNFNKVLTSSNTEDSRMQYSNSRRKTLLFESDYEVAAYVAE